MDKKQAFRQIREQYPTAYDHFGWSGIDVPWWVFPETGDPTGYIIVTDYTGDHADERVVGPLVTVGVYTAEQWSYGIDHGSATIIDVSPDEVVDVVDRITNEITVRDAQEEWGN